MLVSSIEESILLLGDFERAKQVCCVVLIKKNVTQMILHVNLCFLIELLNLHRVCAKSVLQALKKTSNGK